MRKTILFIAGIMVFIFLFIGCPESPGNPDPPPGEVTNLNASVSFLSNRIVLTWIDPADIDFNYCEVWYGKGTSTDTEFSGAVGAEETIITGLIYGESYSFKVIAVDLTGSKSNGVEITVQLPLAEKKLTASDGVINDWFGSSVSLSYSGSTVIVGARKDDDNGAESGSVYVYKWSGSAWAETKLTASDGDVSDYFGNAVGVSSDGNTMVVSASFDDDNGTESGSIYIYKWNGSVWVETKLIASDGATLDYYGRSVDISPDGTTVLAGAYFDDDSGTESGSVYVYKWNGSTWVETKLTASDGSATDHFGISGAVSFDGTTILVGAWNGDGNVADSGSVYIYKWNGSSWIETKLTASDGAVDDRFGSSSSVSSDGTSILVGAFNDDDNGTDSGSVYIYKWNGSVWVETKLTASDGLSGDYFGNSVSISSDGNVVVVGASSDDGIVINLGSVYIYKLNGNTWEEIKLTASDGVEGDNYGISVSTSSDGTSILVGSYLGNGNITDSGSVYIYK